MIGIGSAFGKLMQGNIAGQQMNEANQRMAMLEDKLAQERRDRARQDAFRAVYAAEKFGDWNELKNLSRAYPDMFTDESVRRLNEDEIVSYAPDGTPGLNPQTKRAFTLQTGMDLPEDDAAAIDFLRRYGGAIKDERSGVESFITPAQIAAGFGPGYRMFKHGQDLQEAQILANIQGKQKEAGELEQLTALETKVAKNGINSLTPEENSKYRILSTKYKMTEANAKKNLLEGDYYPIVDRLAKGEAVPEEDVNKAIEAQTLAGLDYKGEQQLSKDLGAYGQLARVNNEIQSEIDKPTKTGAVNAQLMEAVKLAKPEEFKSMTEEDQIATLRTVGRNTKAMNALMTVLKEQSGSAVAEEEFLRVLNTMLGGDINKLNAQVLSKALDTYTRETGEKVKKYIDAVPKRFVGTKASAYQRWQDAMQGSSATEEPPVKPSSTSGTKTFEQVGGEALKQEAKDFWDTLLTFAGLKGDTPAEPVKVVDTLKQMDKATAQKWLDENWAKLDKATQQAIIDAN